VSICRSAVAYNTRTHTKYVTIHICTSLCSFYALKHSKESRRGRCALGNKKELTKAYSKINGRTALRRKYRCGDVRLSSSPATCLVAINARVISPSSREFRERNDRENAKKIVWHKSPFPSPKARNFEGEKADIRSQKVQ